MTSKPLVIIEFKIGGNVHRSTVVPRFIYKSSFSQNAIMNLTH